MTNSIRSDFHSELASLLCDEIQYKKSPFYYFLGKIDSWQTNGEQIPNLEIDSDYENYMIRTNAIYLKKISPNDVSIVVSRYNWISGSFIEKYDHKKVMRNLIYYVVTNDNQVYKCLDNFGGSASIVKPTGKSFYPIRTSDGYLWKYLYTIPSFKRARFMTESYLPVQKALSDSFYNKGSIDTFTIDNSGYGYNDQQKTTISITGPTTGSGATGQILVGSSGNISSATITNGGSQYLKGVNVAFVSVNGVGATANAIISNGVVTGLNITSSGVGYANGDSILFTVGGAILIPSVSSVSGSIIDIKIVKSGAGYTSVPTLMISGSGGSGLYENDTALATAILNNGKIVRTNIQDPGKNYPVILTTTITVTGDGTGATCTPVVYNGQLINVIIENAGVGYTNAKFKIEGSGIGAYVTPIISVSDFSSDQSIVEQTSIQGAIYSVNITNSGNNYTQTVQTIISGDGTGCIGYAEVVGGAIKNIVITEFGSGYTYANIKFVDIGRDLINIKINAEGYVILSPKNGHGYDAVKELHGDTLAINASLRQEPLLTPLMQDFRQFGLTKGMSNIVTGKNLVNDSYLMTYSVIVDQTNNLLVDEILIENDVKYRVVSIIDKTVVLQQLGESGNSNIALLYSEKNSSRTYQVLTINSYPSANKYSGSLLYVSDEQPFVFTEDQGIVIKTFLKF